MHGRLTEQRAALLKTPRDCRPEGGDGDAFKKMITLNVAHAFYALSSATSSGFSEEEERGSVGFSGRIAAAAYFEGEKIFGCGGNIGTTGSPKKSRVPSN